LNCKRIALWLLVGLVIIGISLVILIALNQLSWYISTRSDQYRNSLSSVSAAVTAVLSVIAAVGVLVYVVLTYRLWQVSQAATDQARRTSEATLMSQLMLEYDGMRDSVRTVQQFYEGYRGNPDAALDAFRQALTAPNQRSEIMQDVDPSRFRVSRFFVRMRKLANAGYLSRRIVWLAIQRAAIENVFLALVDPMDQVVNAVNKKSQNVADRDFYRQLLQDHHRLES